jgi:hypothetical protein
MATSVNKEISKKFKIVETYGNDHSLESSWGALSDGNHFWTRDFNKHFLENIPGNYERIRKQTIFSAQVDNLEIKSAAKVNNSDIMCLWESSSLEEGQGASEWNGHEWILSNNQ